MISISNLILRLLSQNTGQLSQNNNSPTACFCEVQTDGGKKMG